MTCYRQTRSISGCILLFLKRNAFNGDGYSLNLNLLAILNSEYNITIHAVAPVWKTLNVEIIARELKFL